MVLPGIGVVRVEGADFAPKSAAVIVYRDSEGWTAEFEAPERPTATT